MKKTREEATESVSLKEVVAGFSGDIERRWRGFSPEVVQRLLPAVADAVRKSLAADTIVLVNATTTRSKVAERWRLAIEIVADMGAAGWPVTRIAETLAHALRARLDGHPFDPRDDSRQTWVPEVSEEYAWRG